MKYMVSNQFNNEFAKLKEESAIDVIQLLLN